MIFSNTGTDYGILILRLFFGIMIFTHGLQKAAGFPEAAETFPDPIGLGSRLSYLLITATEIGGGLFVAAGLLTRLTALVLVFGMAVAAFIVHKPFTVSGSELALVYMMAFVVLAVTGGGRFSADNLLANKFCRKKAA